MRVAGFSGIGTQAAGRDGRAGFRPREMRRRCEVRRKLIALLVLLVLPFLMVATTSVPIEAGWGYFYSKMGMSDLGLGLWAGGTAIMCTLAFTGVGALGCGLSAAG
jgi:hypothetical protein